MAKGMYVGYRINRASPYSRASRSTRPSSAKRVSFKRSSTRKKVKSLKKQLRRVEKNSALSKLKTENVRPDGPISESFMAIPTWVKKTFMPKFDKRSLGKWTYTRTEKVPLSWPQNQQSYTQCGYFNNADIAAMVGTLTSTYIPGQSTVKNFKLLLEHCKADLLISNATSDVVAFKIYDVVARTNISTAAYADPASCWLQGSTDQGTSSDITTPGTNPFVTSAFTKLYKVVKVTDVWLHSGGHHCHQLKITPRYVFDNEELLNIRNNGGTTNTAATIGGLTCFSLLVGHGFPVNEYHVPGTVALAQGQLECVVIKNYDYRAVQISNAAITLSNNLDTLMAQQMINDLTGVSQTVEVA